MRIVLLVIHLLAVSLLLSQSTNYRDTLEVEIGSGAKVIFLAEDAKDFEAIDRYDLNFIFDELWQRRKQGETGIADLSKDELTRLKDGLPTQESELITDTLTSKSRRRFYLNISMGVSPGVGATIFSDPFTLNAFPDTELRYEVWSDFRPSSGYELSLGTDFELGRKQAKPLVIRTAVGISNTPYQLKNFRLMNLFSTTGQASDEAIDQIKAEFIESEWSVDEKISMLQIFLQAIPTFTVWEDRKNSPFTYGIGPKIGIGIRDSGERELGKPIPVFGWGGVNTNLFRPRMQYAVVNQLMYRSLHLYAQFYPRAYLASTDPNLLELKRGLRSQGLRANSIWSIGLTIGI